MSARWPWGAGPAPALHCEGCRHRLGKNAGHIITENTHLVCTRCLFTTTAHGRELHARFHPDCPTACRGLLDHPTSSATRAGAWFVLHRNTHPETPTKEKTTHE